MKIEVALVRVDERYWVDRQIAKIKGGQQYSHGAFIVERPGLEPTWWDIHWRWLVSDLRVIPVKNYGWEFDRFQIPNLTLDEAAALERWLLQQRKKKINYDVLQVVSHWLADKLNWSKIPFNNPAAFQCFEFLLAGLRQIGRGEGIDSSTVLASDLLSSGLLTR